MLEYFDDAIKNLLKANPTAGAGPGAVAGAPVTSVGTPPPGPAAAVSRFGARALGRAALGATATGGALAAIPLAAEAFASQSNPNYVPNLPTGFAETPGGAATGVQLPVRTGYAGNVPSPIDRGPSALGQAITGIGYDARQAAAATTAARTTAAAAPVVTPAVDAGGDNFDRMGTQRAPTPYDQADAAASRATRADALLREIDTQVGPGGYNGDAINARIRGFGANPGAADKFNEVQTLNGTGIKMTRDAQGRVTFSDAPISNPKQYSKPDGTLTTNYNESEQYTSGVARAAADRTQLASITADKESAAALRQIYNNRSAVGRKQAIDLYIAQQGLRGEQAKLAQTAAIAAGKQGIDVQKLVLDSIRTRAEVADKGASTGVKNFQLNAAMESLMQGGTPAEASAVLAGRATPGDRYVFDPNELPNAKGTRQRMNSRTGEVQAVPVRTRAPSEVEIAAVMKANPKMTREEVLANARQNGRY